MLHHNPSLTSVKLSLPMWTNPELVEAIAELDKQLRELDAMNPKLSYLHDKREILQQALNTRNHKVA